MEKQFLKRKLPDLILVEGFWNLGKSNLVNYIRELNKYELIEEPDHLKKGTKKNISEWYAKKHNERWIKAISLLDKGNKVILERSIISNLSYSYTQKGKLSAEEKRQLKSLKKIIDTHGEIIFLYGNRDFVLKQTENIKDEEVKSSHKLPIFYKRYMEFYKTILPQYINYINLIKVDKKGNFKDWREIYNSFYRLFPLKEKVSSECVSVIAYYKSQILLLYDYKYNHYVLPQGHCEKGESFIQTALREVAEETGYNNLKPTKKIKKYQYHYPTKNAIKYKTIHVFLMEVLNLKRIKKKLERHESYANHFFGVDNAINTVRWPQDKEAIKEASLFIKSPRTSMCEDDKG